MITVLVKHGRLTSKYAAFTVQGNRVLRKDWELSNLAALNHMTVMKLMLAELDDELKDEELLATIPETPDDLDVDRRVREWMDDGYQLVIQVEIED